MYLVGAVSSVVGVGREIGSYRRRARCLSFVLPSSALRCAGTTQDKSERDGRKQSLSFCLPLFQFFALCTRSISRSGFRSPDQGRRTSRLEINFDLARTRRWISTAGNRQKIKKRFFAICDICLNPSRDFRPRRT